MLHTKHHIKKVVHSYHKWWKEHWMHKVLTILAICVVFIVIVMFAIAKWYAYTERNKPYIQGVTFIPSYASSLGVDPEQNMAALISIGVRNYRLVSYWNEIEPSPGQYDFSSLDWQFAQVAKAKGTVSLSIGLRQPRWPECHAPSWINTTEPASKWQPQLEAFMTAVINRYKNNPSLVSYQLENEYFNQFGDCYNFDRNRLSDELALVKKLDPNHPVIISRSNNYAGFMLRQPLPDIVGISVYRRVWDSQVTHRYFEYPFPAWYYGFLAGAEKLLTGKDSVIHEFQAEPWPPNGKNITDISLAEQNKSFDAARFKDRINFAKQTGIPVVYYWGAEYWYYRMVVLHDPSVWNVAKQEFAND